MATIMEFENDLAGASDLYELATADEFILTDEDAVRQYAAVALRNRVRCLMRLGNSRLAKSLYNKLLELFLPSNDAVIRLQVAYAMRDRATISNENRNYNEVIAVEQASELATHDTQDEHLLAVATSVRVQYALALLRKEEFNVALYNAEEIITRRRKGRIRFVSDADCLLAYYVATAALLGLRRVVEAKNMLAEAEEQFGKQNRPRVEDLFSDIRHKLEG